MAAVSCFLRECSARSLHLLSFGIHQAYWELLWAWPNTIPCLPLPFRCRSPSLRSCLQRCTLLTLSLQLDRAWEALLRRYQPIFHNEAPPHQIDQKACRWHHFSIDVRESSMQAQCLHIWREDIARLWVHMLVASSICASFCSRVLSAAQPLALGRVHHAGPIASCGVGHSQSLDRFFPCLLSSSSSRWVFHSFEASHINWQWNLAKLTAVDVRQGDYHSSS